LRDEDLGPLFAEVNPEVIKENTNPTTVRRRIEGGAGMTCPTVAPARTAPSPTM
jgi:hypothetical protein